MPEINSIRPAEYPTTNVQVYYPSEIIDIFNDFLSRTGMGVKVVFVTGIYLKTAKQAYSGYYYDTLKDQKSDQELALKIPQLLRDGLDNGSLVTIGGTIYRQSGNRGNIQLGLKVSRVETLQQQAVSEEDMKRAELRAIKTQKGLMNVDALLESILMKGDRPKVALIFATSSITMADFDAGKKAAEASMDFTEYRVNFASSKDLCDLLGRVDGQGYDVLALIRGGGSGIEHLDDLSVIEKIVDLSTPLICAVGHVEEKLFLKLVADKVAPTPNGLGQWFSDLAEKISKTRAESVAVITEQVKKQFQERIAAQEKQNKELQSKLDALTKQAGEGQKQTAENNRKLQEQLAEANKKNGELAKTLQEQARSHSEQMKTLNASMEGLKKQSADQATKQQESLGKLQKSNEDLVKSNSELNQQLSSARSRISQLENGKGNNGAAIIIVIVIAIIIMIIAFAVR